MQEQHAFNVTKSALEVVRHASVCWQLNHSNSTVLVPDLHWTRALPHALRLKRHLPRHCVEHMFPTWAQQADPWLNSRAPVIAEALQLDTPLDEAIVMHYSLCYIHVHTVIVVAQVAFE